MRFFKIPPNSVPITSVLVKVVKYELLEEEATCLADSKDSDAATDAAGCSAAISAARFGPETTTILEASMPASAIT